MQQPSLLRCHCNELAGLQPYIEYFVGTHCPSDLCERVSLQKTIKHMGINFPWTTLSDDWLQMIR